ncbi:MAG: hypothetical protein ACKO2G_12790 [Verrucomicrobiales bacterium]
MSWKKFESVTLHVGHDKTGSTAIQSAMDTHRESLLAEGYLYPNGRWHAPLGSYFHDEPEKYDGNPLASREEIRRLDAEWMKRLLVELDSTSARHVVFSYEGFFNLPESTWRRIREFFLRHTAQIRIVGYCRRPEDYAISAISQQIKSGRIPWGRYTGKLAELRLATASRASDWRLGLPIVFYKNNLPKMQRIFGKENMVIRKFGRDELTGGDVVADFLSIFDLSDPLIRKVSSSRVRENPSLGAAAIQTGLYLLRRRDELRISADESRTKIVPLLEEIPGSKPVLHEDERWRVLEASRKESVYLDEEWASHFDDPVILRSTPPMLSDKELQSLAGELLKRAGF